MYMMYVGIKFNLTTLEVYMSEEQAQELREQLNEMLLQVKTLIEDPELREVIKDVAVVYAEIIKDTAPLIAPVLKEVYESDAMSPFFDRLIREIEANKQIRG